MQILGQAKDPAVIQAHLKKLFAGIHGVALSDNKDAITAAMSIESENVHLAQAVAVSEHVEGWLHNLLSGMQGTLQVVTPSCVHLKTLRSVAFSIMKPDDKSCTCPLYCPSSA